jgi:hypothetical protein
MVLRVEQLPAPGPTDASSRRFSGSWVQCTENAVRLVSLVRGQRQGGDLYRAVGQCQHGDTSPAAQALLPLAHERVQGLPGIVRHGGYLKRLVPPGPEAPSEIGSARMGNCIFHSLPRSSQGAAEERALSTIAPERRPPNGTFHFA